MKPSIQTQSKPMSDYDKETLRIQAQYRKDDLIYWASFWVGVAIIALPLLWAGIYDVTLKVTGVAP